MRRVKRYFLDQIDNIDDNFCSGESLVELHFLFCSVRASMALHYNTASVRRHYQRTRKKMSLPSMFNFAQLNNALCLRPQKACESGVSACWFRSDWELSQVFDVILRTKCQWYQVHVYIVDISISRSTRQKALMSV